MLVDTVEGTLEGTEVDGVAAFLGVRYAEPPVGERRFLAPAPLASWSGVRDATAFGNRAIQGVLPEGIDLTGIGELPGAEDEDCLFLNVWTPAADGARRPVLVWIHGGSLKYGSANDHPGDRWAAKDDVVVVTVGYRLGILGFADLQAIGLDGSAANGVRDQTAALQWVARNIASFGGDPENVTIIGQSAGASSVFALIASPAADGLFHKAVASSGGGVIDPPADASAPLAALVGVPVDELLATLRSMPAADVVRIGDPVVPGSVGVDGVVVTRPVADALRARDIPLVTGINDDEGFGFVALPLFDAMGDALVPVIAPNVVGAAGADAYVARLRAAMPGASGRELCGRLFDDLFLRSALVNAEAAPAAWLYRFAVPDSTGRTAHGVEVSFTFDGPAAWDRDVARWWSSALATFARTGDPNGPGLPEWPRYDADERASLVVAPVPVVEHDLGGNERRLWDV